MTVPSPATLKELGRKTARTLGYPISGNATGPVIWDLVKFHAQERGTIMIHFDEAQDIAVTQTKMSDPNTPLVFKNEREWQAVINTLKSLQQNKSWPITLVLSGVPILKQVVNKDVQLMRRLKAFEIPKLVPATDRRNIEAVLRKYIATAGIMAQEDLFGDLFIERLAHSANYNLGTLIKLTKDAILTSLKTDPSTPLATPQFAAAYKAKNATSDPFNPFLAPNFLNIDTTIAWS